MSEETKTSDLYSITDKRGYFYKVASYCDLWRYHDFEFMYQQGHPYNNREAEIVKVVNTDESLQQYYEILFNLLCLDTDKRTRYDVVSRISITTGEVPDLGIDVLELTDFYHCGDLTRGLFVYHVNFDSTAYNADIREGDVIVSASRPEVELTPSSNWKKNMYTVTWKDDKNMEFIDRPKTYKTYGISSVDEMMRMFSWCRNNERIIFNIIRDGVEIKVPVNVPLKKVAIKRFSSPQIVVKTIPRFDIRNNNLRMTMTEVWNETNRVATQNMNELFSGLTCQVTNDGQLVMDMPENLNNVEFFFTEDGQLAVKYD